MSEGPVDRDKLLAGFRRRFQENKADLQAIDPRNPTHAQKLIANTDEFLELMREWRRAGFTDDQISY